MRKRRAARCWRLPSLPTACLLPGHRCPCGLSLHRGPGASGGLSVKNEMIPKVLPRNSLLLAGRQSLEIESPDHGKSTAMQAVEWVTDD